MGRKGWAGSPPADDIEAAKRIVDAAIRCVEVGGAQGATLSEVALALGITRRTIYRYFATTEELFAAVGEAAFDSFLTRLEAATAGLSDASDLLVESVAYIIEHLPNEPLLTLFLDVGEADLFSRRMLTAAQIERCRIILLHKRVDWRGLGYDDRALDELVEYLLRYIQSTVVAPPDPPRTGGALRRHLRRWLVPAIEAQRNGRR
jgi:AcrR family transcriptional regulator